MRAILYSDLTAVHIPKLQAMLDASDEPYADGAKVSNRVLAGAKRMITVQAIGGTGASDTIDREYHVVNVYANDEADAADLTALTRAFITARGHGTVCDGNPVVFTGINVHPAPVETVDETYRWRMIVELRRRGIQL